MWLRAFWLIRKSMTWSKFCSHHQVFMGDLNACSVQPFALELPSFILQPRPKRTFCGCCGMLKSISIIRLSYNEHDSAVGSFSIINYYFRLQTIKSISNFSWTNQKSNRVNTNIRRLFLSFEKIQFSRTFPMNIDYKLQPQSEKCQRQTKCNCQRWSCPMSSYLHLLRLR